MTDGCTMAPDLEFSECCVEHDLNYCTIENTREQADHKLRICIYENGYPVLSVLYWITVRIVGWYPYYFGAAYGYRKEYRKTL